MVIWSDAPSNAKGASVRRPSIVTCLSSPVLIAPPPYTIVRLSGFHANAVIGTGLVTSNFGFPRGCGTTQSSYVAPFCQRRKASHWPSGEKAGETSCAASGPSVSACGKPPEIGNRYSRSAKAAFKRFEATMASLSGAHVRYLRADGREPGRLATTRSGPPAAGITTACAVAASIVRRNAILVPSRDQTGFVSSWGPEVSSRTGADPPLPVLNPVTLRVTMW